MRQFSASENGAETRLIFGYLGLVFSSPADLRGAEVYHSFLDPADPVLESAWPPFPGSGSAPFSRPLGPVSDPSLETLLRPLRDHVRGPCP